MHSAPILFACLLVFDLVHSGNGPLSFSSRTHYAKCEGCARLGDTIRITPQGEDSQDGDSFSFEIWVNVHPWPARSSGQEGMGWAFMHAGPCSYHQCAFLGFRHDGAAIFGFILNDLIVDAHDFRPDENKWIHWSGTFDRATRERKLYRNGELVGTDIATAGYNPHSSDLFIGQDNWSNHPFPGEISEIRLWRGVVLDAEVIKKFMCAGHTPPLAAGAWLKHHPHASALVIHFQFDGSDETNADDSKGVYEERSLVFQEGTTVGGGEPNYTLDKCKQECDTNVECLSFSFSESHGACFLKSQCVSHSVRENPSTSFKTYFKKCKQRTVSAVNNPTIELHLEPGVRRDALGIPHEVCSSWTLPEEVNIVPQPLLLEDKSKHPLKMLDDLESLVIAQKASISSDVAIDKDSSTVLAVTGVETSLLQKLQDSSSRLRVGDTDFAHMDPQNTAALVMVVVVCLVGVMFVVRSRSTRRTLLLPHKRAQE
eukprot:c5098_g1_i1.p1 GENE.c5098_g1_i1~~c5098_g1_i1.p1  ORF type:complete len:484 (+),score=66.79 c5098_g1_i1:86-1537(+)